MVLSNLKIGLEDRIKDFGNNIKRKIVVGVLSAGLAFSPYGCGDSKIKNEYINPDSAQAGVYQCNDGIDNDEDTMTDFNDIGCYFNGLYDPNRDSELQVQIYQCSDKVDNDGDTRLDLDDVGCYVNGIFDPSDDNEINDGIYKCNNGLDDDNDSFIDWGLDVDCSSPMDDDEFPFVLPQCSDWINNDSDNYIDINDAGCYNSNGMYDPNDNDESNNGVTQCSDNIDNDNDGFIDWPADLSCLNPLYDNESSTGGTSSVCSDGIDNDGDTKIDYNDLGCYLDGLYNPNDDGEDTMFTPDSNTIALYYFNELSGNNVADSSVNGLNGTASGTTIVDGVYGKARSFDGIDDYVGVVSSSLFNITSDLTLDAYVKWNLDNGEIVGKSGPGGTSYRLYVNLSKLRFTLSKGGSLYDCISNNSVPVRRWVHLACVFNASTQTMQVFMDGILENTCTGPVNVDISTTDIRIGMRAWGESQFNGVIDEVRISNIVRY